MKRSIGERIGNALIVLIMLFFALSTLYPLWHVFMYAVSDSKAAIGESLFLWPKGFSLKQFSVLVGTANMLRSFLNSVARVLIGVPWNILMTALLAYPLSRRELIGRKAMCAFVFFTMIFNGGLIPTFITLKTLGFYNNPLVYILPVSISAYNMFVMRNYFISLPKELEESASIDGAEPVTVLFRILLPCCIPVIAALTMFYGIAHWNSWFDGIIYIDSRKYQLFQVFLRGMMTEGAYQNLAGSNTLANVGTLTEESVKMAAISLSIIPIIIVYPFIQRYYIRGLLVGSVKG